METYWLVPPGDSEEVDSLENLLPEDTKVEQQPVVPAVPARLLETQRSDSIKYVEYKENLDRVKDREAVHVEQVAEF